MPIALPTDSPALLLIQRIRDEAHRFAMTFHRLSRTKRDLRSELDVIAGIGPRRRKSLLTAFGSVAGVRRATREELMKVVGAKSADAVLAHFAREGQLNCLIRAAAFRRILLGVLGARFAALRSVHTSDRQSASTE